MAKKKEPVYRIVNLKSLLFTTGIGLLLIVVILAQYVFRTQKQTIVSKADTTPGCNPANVLMAIDPNPSSAGSQINFSVSGTEGDTFIEDSWMPAGGVNCSGTVWGTKTCAGQKEGIYTWEHKWKKCVGSLTNCSSLCTKSLGFTISVRQAPTSTPMPLSTAVPTPTLTLTPSPTPTPTPASVSVKLKLKFQGITTKPKGSQNKLELAIAFKNEKKSIFQTVTKEFSADNNLIWSNADSINLTLSPDNSYLILVKGPKHLQKKICDNYPDESGSGWYTCRNNSYVTLREGENILDFSNIMLFSGDLPQQDGYLNSYDLSLVKNNLGKNDSRSLQIADVNLDGVVDSQDFSLLLSAMSIKADEF